VTPIVLLLNNTNIISLGKRNALQLYHVNTKLYCHLTLYYVFTVFSALFIGLLMWIVKGFNVCI